MKKSELLVDYCQLCGAEIGTQACCKNHEDEIAQDEANACEDQNTEEAWAEYDRMKLMEQSEAEGLMECPEEYDPSDDNHLEIT